MKKNSAQAGIIHIGLVIALIVVGALGYFFYQNPQIKNQLASAASNKGTFSNLTSVLKSDTATFNFSYSGSTGSYRVDVSTSSNLKTNTYNNFGTGSSSPIIVTSPQTKWSGYKCSSTIYWRISTVNGQINGPVQTGVVDCTVPTPTPTPTPTSTPTSTPTPAPTATPPATVTMQGSDGTWCYDPDNRDSCPITGCTKPSPYDVSSNCNDAGGTYADYCQDSGTVRDGYCTGSWNGSSWSGVHCDFGGFVCSSVGKTCSSGACI